MDAIAVEAVLESPAECSDADRARAALIEALGAARAPARGVRSVRAAPAHWTVSMTVAPARGAGPKSVEALIQDDLGNIVAHRTLTDRSARACLPLARAVSAWASLVLDAELTRAKDDDSVRPQAATAALVASPASPASPAIAGRPGAGLPERDGGIQGAPPPARRSIELGTMVYLRNGMTPTGGFAGVSPFVTIEVASGWVLRPSLAFGRATSPIPVAVGDTAMMSHIGARTDFCGRIPGNYIERRGIEADLCAGVEGGVISSEGNKAFPGGGSAARLGMGPSVNLRGELAGGLALEVRGLLGANLLNAPLQAESAAPLVFASAELGISLRLP